MYISDFQFYKLLNFVILNKYCKWIMNIWVRARTVVETNFVDLFVNFSLGEHEWIIVCLFGVAR
jgi:hypothetical protein